MALTKDWREFLELLNSRRVGSGPRSGQQPHRLELHERRKASFSCRLIFVRTNAAFSASILRKVARWVPLVSERELQPLSLLERPARVQPAAVLPLALCVSPFLFSVFPQRCAQHRPTR